MLKENEAWTNHGQTLESTFKSVEITIKSVDNHTPRSPQRTPDRQRCPEATRLAALFKKTGLQYQHVKHLCTHIVLIFTAGRTPGDVESEAKTRLKLASRGCHLQLGG